MPRFAVFACRLLPVLLLGACAVQDSRLAERAQTRLIGLSEVDLESCLGVPDQHASFGGTDVLTYYATSSSSTSYAVPIVGGLGLSNGGYCHATFRVDDGRVSRLLYSGEKNATLAPSSYCAPIVRTCLAWLDRPPMQRGAVGTPAYQPAGYRPDTSTTSQGLVPPGSPSGAPQPGASNAAMPSAMPTATPALSSGI